MGVGNGRNCEWKIPKHVTVSLCKRTMGVVVHGLES